ncbi:MAG: S8 family serine peptidase [Flavobacteriales bacterium]|nr:S8 family serine peptidase [Flavobacteriales bacterium]
MKKLKNLIALVAISLVGCSCSNDEQEFVAKQKENSELNARSSSNQTRNYSNNSLVIKFIDGVSEADKQFLRNFYEVTTYKLCSHCSDKSIELWKFDDTINIEPRKITIDDPTGGGMNFPLPYPYYNYIQSVDYNFEVKFATNDAYANVNLATSALLEYNSYIKSSNDGVTIAVFDTGLNINGFGGEPLFLSEFLYNASSDGIPGIFSGWDFVNNDHNCLDDNPGLHGTAVTSIITEILNNDLSPVPHQIMPLKICDANGVASYFNLLCALNYALDRRVPVIQMSLGWYDNDSGDLVDNIFLDLMSDHPDTTIICSAGNNWSNNDTTIHCPSGYDINNIIAVASCNALATDISSWSNYGATSVDFFAVGENINFSGISIEGTSFAAPKVAAMVAKIKHLNPSITNDQLIDALLDLGIYCSPSFSDGRPVLYNKILVP